MWKPAIALFFLAPLIGEFLLGNLPITFLPALIVLAPLYGGGALLVRELARHRGLGWPGIVLLALAYAVLEEGIITQSLFNPDYAGQRLLDFGWIPPLGMGSWWTVFVLSLHVIWSIAVPIALVETFSGTRPWLSWKGLTVTSVLFVLGCLAVATVFNGTPYMPSVPQLVGTFVVIGVLVVIALRLAPLTAAEGQAPSTRMVAVVSFGGGALFWGGWFLFGSVPAFLLTAFYVVLLGSAAWLIVRWSRRQGWGERHVYALALGGILTYVWHGFVQPPVVPTPPFVDLAGNVFFALVTLGLLLYTARRWRRQSVSTG